jgi:short subunit dehydrogenase-like uncharacterized protein
MAKRWLLYGANGYTGDLVSRFAKDRDLSPVIAGRSTEAIQTLGRDLGLETRVFGLEDAAAIDRGLDGIDVVLHCAGPFARTAAPMVEACLRRRVHYLDVTGEIEVFASIAERGRVARELGVMLLPGVGFDVVPSDGLAAHVAGRCPGAQSLEIAFRGIGRASRGTATTMAENAGRGGVVRRGGHLRAVPAAWHSRDVDFGRGPVKCVSIPWGDVFTAFLSTGIPDITVYMAAPPLLRTFLRTSRSIAPVLRSQLVVKAMRWWIRRGPAGPTDDERAAGSSHLWARATTADGRVAESRLHGPEGYTATVMCALSIVTEACNGNFVPGFQTPSKAYGPDLPLTAAGFTREDL